MLFRSGYAKRDAVTRPRLGFGTLLAQYKDHPFILILDDLSKMFADHYKLLDLPSEPRPPMLPLPTTPPAVPEHLLNLVFDTPDSQEAYPQSSNPEPTTPIAPEQHPEASEVESPGAPAWFLVAVPLTPDTSPLANHDLFLKALRSRLINPPVWPHVGKRLDRLIQTVPGEVGMLRILLRKSLRGGSNYRFHCQEIGGELLQYFDETKCGCGRPVHSD